MNTEEDGDGYSGLLGWKPVQIALWAEKYQVIKAYIL